jgi:hypothetical protein
MAIGTALAVQAGVGALQSFMGFQAAKNATRPEYRIPDAIETNMSQAERMQYYGLPDAQKKEYLQNIERAGTAQVSALSDRKAGIAGAITVAQQQRDSYMSLLSADAQQRLANIQRLMDVRSNYAQYEDKEFMLNQLEPFQQEMAAAQQFQAAGMQNIFGALKGATQLKMENIDLFDQKTNEVVPTPEPDPVDTRSSGMLINTQPGYQMGDPARGMGFNAGFGVNTPSIQSNSIPLQTSFLRNSFSRVFNTFPSGNMHNEYNFE